MVRAPVDDPVRAVDPAVVPQPHEEREHRSDVGLVEREPLTLVVHRRAQAPELTHDRATGRLQPLPGALDERLAPEIVAGQPLSRELLLDDVLGGDPGVVVAGLPEGVVAHHPVPADQAVLDRPVERMPHVELAGDVRRRHADDVGLVAAAAGAGRVEALGLPGLLPALLDAVGAVQAVHLLLGHRGQVYGAARHGRREETLRRAGSPPEPFGGATAPCAKGSDARVPCDVGCGAARRTTS